MSQSARRAVVNGARFVVSVSAIPLAVMVIGASAARASPPSRVVVRPAIAGSAPASAPANPKPPTMTVVSQTAWVGNAPNDAFRIGLRFGPQQPEIERLSITVYDRLTSRTSFDDSLSGRIRGTAEYQQSVAVKSLPRSDGAVQVTLPIGGTRSSGPASPGTLPPDAQVTSDQNFVYPLRISALDGQGRAVGQPVITYLVWVPKPTGFPKLQFSLMVPLHEAPSLTAAGKVPPLTPGAVSALQAEAQVLAKHPDVPVTVAATPQTVDALAGAGKAGQAAVGAWTSAIKSTASEVLPAPYVRVNLSAMAASGLDSEVTPQLDTGTAVLAKDLGVPVDTSTWALTQPVEQATVSTLHARGATQLILPDSTLSVLPSALQQNTFAQPAHLSGSPVAVFGADAGLQAHFTSGEDQVLQANQLLAELAMIQTEQPSDARGVAVLPRDDWQPEPVFLQAVLSGLQGNPLVSAVTDRQLFAVPVAMMPGRDVAVSRTLNDRGLPASPLSDASAISALRGRISALETTLSGADSQIAALSRSLLVTQSSDLSNRERSAAIASLTRALGNGFAGLQLPQSVSVTLTSNSGTVPITIFNGGGTAHVRLRLTSQKLTFRPFNPPGGSCQVTSSTTQECSLTLTGPSTLLRLPVEARATGVFSLNLDLLTSDGNAVISHQRYTVRSTAISGVAVILTVGALALLALWWLRDRRHRHRAGPLIPATAAPGSANPAQPQAAEARTVDDPAGSQATEGVGNREPWLDEDPVVARFFDEKPPTYEKASPARSLKGASDRRRGTNDAPQARPGR